METLQLSFSASPVWILACIACGGLYSWLLYSKKVEWSVWLNRVLSAFRFVVVALLCFLLLQPVLNLNQNTYENPIVTFVIDDSESMKMVGDSSELRSLMSTMSDVSKQMAEKSIDVKWRTLDANAKTGNEIKFSRQGSDLQKGLKAVDYYRGANLGAVVFLSDGIYTQGVAPSEIMFNVPVVTIGVGDTTSQKDASIVGVLYNKISYLENEFQIKAEVIAKGLRGNELTIDLTQGDKIIESKKWEVKSDAESEYIKFDLTSQKVGTQHYQVKVREIEDEFTFKNNVRHAYVDIVDTRQKILLLAQAPHPDIRVIKSIIENNDELELDVVVLSIDKKVPVIQEYSLIIMHQLPGPGLNTNDLNRIKDAKQSILWLAGTQTNFKELNKVNDVAQIVVQGNQTDEVTALLNPDFEIFELKDWKDDFLRYTPPVIVPYGDVNPKGGTEIVLEQQIGSVGNEKPLAMVSDVLGVKNGLILGEGYWKWRLFELLETDESKMFDNFFMKMIQYLAIREDKNKFRVYSIRDEYLEREVPKFSIQCFNDLYENIFDVKVNLELIDENGVANEFDFTTAEGIGEYRTKSLKEGVYKYGVKAEFLNNKHIASGSFVIKKLRIEIPPTE